MKKSKLPVKADWKNFRFSWGKVKELYLIAIPSAVVTAVPSTLVGILNGLLMQFSQTAVAVFGVYFKIQSFVNMPASGLIQGMRPIVSYNYGAGNKDRIKQVMRASLNVVGAIMIVGMCLFIGFGRPIMEVFSQDEAMIAMGVSALRISSASFVFSAFAIVLSGTFEAFGQGIFSLFDYIFTPTGICPSFCLWTVCSHRTGRNLAGISGGRAVRRRMCLYNRKKGAV